MRKPLIWLVTILLVAAGPLEAQKPQPQDTAQTENLPPFFTYGDLLLTAAFVGGTVVLAPLDLRMAEELQEPESQENRFLHKSATFFRYMGQPAPQIIAVGLYGVGKLTHNERLTKLALHGAEAMLLTTAAVTTIKFAAGRARPERDTTNNFDFQFTRGFKGWDFQSFPSGHSATAFTVAAATTAEVSHWVDESHWSPSIKYIVGVTLFSGATLVGVSRMYNNAHWASDVAVGAAIGTFSGLKVVRYNHRHPGNRLERLLASVTVVPGGGGSPTVLAVRLTPSSLGLAPAH